MEDLEKIQGILKHCISGECFGCYLRKSHQCERSTAFLANQAIAKLVKRIGELEKRNAELEARCAVLADQVSEEG